MQQQIKRALKQIELDEQSGENGVDADIVFRSIMESNGQPTFSRDREFLFDFLTKAAFDHAQLRSSGGPPCRNGSEEHQRIVDAISRQDEEAARAATREHMEGASTPSRLGRSQAFHGAKRLR